MLRRYKVGQVLYSDVGYSSPIYDEWRGLLEEKSITRTSARVRQEVDLGDITIEVLNPPSPLLAGTASDIDNNSVVLRLSKGEVSFLLTADIMWETEFELTARRANLTSTVLKVAHHGSATSTSTEFLAVVSPQLVVVTVGKDNPFGHPGGEVMDRLTEKVSAGNIYRTDKNGAIELITDGEKLRVSLER